MLKDQELSSYFSIPSAASWEPIRKNHFQEVWLCILREKEKEKGREEQAEKKMVCE